MRRPGRKRVIQMFFMDNWGKMLITVAVVALVIAAIIGLNSLESFYRKMTLATMPIQFLMVGMNALIFVFLYSTVLRGGFTKMNNVSVKGSLVDVKWNDVIGVDEAKKEAMEVVELIKDHKKVETIGGKILKGLLLIGPPGCGKTLLAKAMATEAGLPILTMSGSEFTEVFVGVGASRVRQLFKKAQRLAYGYGGCIIFLDELDVIGRARSFSMFGGGQETNSTLNQLLVNMDGMNSARFNIICMGATNAAEGVLDEALLRPGRFDRKVFINKPNVEGREKVFEFYLSKVKADPNIDVKHLARKTVYKSPADIENIVKEAALIATREKKELVTYKDISAAIERIELGVEHKYSGPDLEREMTAYHEIGHLVVLYREHPTQEVFKASIKGRSGSLGVVHSQPREEWHAKTKEMLFADIKWSLGSYVAEKLKYGTTTSGVGGDFQSAMKIAHYMVWNVGMGDSGFLGDMTILQGNNGGSSSFMSDAMKDKLNNDVQALLKKAISEVEVLLKRDWEVVEILAQELLAKNELEYDEIEKIFKDFDTGNTSPEPEKATT